MTMIRRLIRTIKRASSMPVLPDSVDNESLAWNAYHGAQAILETLGLAVDLSGKWVLDVGCGLGGKTVYYAEQGAQWVVGLEVSQERARVAAKLAAVHPVGAKVRIVIGDAARLPFRADLFDCVISTDTWEHLRAPVLALRECARVVQPGGTVSISVLPYFSPWGAHAWNWLPLPWIQVLLPRPWLFRLISWLERRQQVNARLPSAVRMDWANPDDPAHAHRLTVAALERSLPLGGMRTLRFTLVPVGMRHGGIAARMGQALSRVPWLRELLVGMVILVMRKRVLEE
jgi:SAM-dependent methyltransferase